MSSRKPDRAIGQRACEEMLRMDSTVAEQSRRMGIDKNSFYNWQRGESCPNARALQALAVCGYDVFYILTGWRKEK